MPRETHSALASRFLTVGAALDGLSDLPGEGLAVRAAIYARVSTDLQSNDSVLDQESRCREFADRRGWEVAASESDQRISGASADRPGLERILSRIDEWDVLLVWDSSRLARNEALYFSIFERVEAEDRRMSKFRRATTCWTSADGSVGF